ncbi:NAD(P)-binding protein [Aspergillus californicus]
MSSSKRTIVVVGGTGRVGGSVARSLHDNPNFLVKVTSRNPHTEKARGIASLGIQVIKADSWHASKLDTAFTGAWGVFLNTDSEDASFKGEIGQPEQDMGRIVIDAARRQGVQHFVYAGLPDVDGVTQGAVSVVSFHSKGLISRYGRQAGFESFVNVNVGWMMENFWNPLYEVSFGGFARVPDAEGFLTIKLFAMGNDPESTPWTSVRDDYGDIVHGVFLGPVPWNGQVIWAVSASLSFEQVATTYNKLAGKNVARYVLQRDPVDAGTPGKTKEVNGVRDWSHFVHGNYCDGKPVDQTDVKRLKAAAADARGRHGADAELQTFEGFMRAYGFNGESM